MSDLVGNPNCWYSHAQAQKKFSEDKDLVKAFAGQEIQKCKIKHFGTVNGSNINNLYAVCYFECLPLTS